MFRYFWPFCFALILVGNIYCQEKVIVSISHAGDDYVGNRLRFRIKEILLRSPAYEYNDKSDIVISLISMDSNCSGEGNSSFVTVTFSKLTTVQESYMGEIQPLKIAELLIGTPSLYLVGSNRIQDIAETIVSQFDEAFERFSQDKF